MKALRYLALAVILILTLVFQKVGAQDLPQGSPVRVERHGQVNLRDVSEQARLGHLKRSKGRRIPHHGKGHKRHEDGNGGEAGDGGDTGDGGEEKEVPALPMSNPNAVQFPDVLYN